MSDDGKREMPRRKPMKGRRKITRTSGGELARLSDVTPEDVLRARESWKNDAQGPARRLLDATHPPEPGEDSAGAG